MKKIKIWNIYIQATLYNSSL